MLPEFESVLEFGLVPVWVWLWASELVAEVDMDFPAVEKEEATVQETVTEEETVQNRRNPFSSVKLKRIEVN